MDIKEVLDVLKTDASEERNNVKGTFSSVPRTVWEEIKYAKRFKRIDHTPEGLIRAANKRLSYYMDCSG